MALVEFASVDLKYPVRENHGFTLKEFVLRGLLRQAKPTVKFVHALKKLSFRIDDGERVGIIGGNGAGKSTLLRTIAGVYPIAAGERNVAGSVCSLLDYTVGFEPEATGWQNIYYRGFLQGDTPREVRGKLPNIAEFTELGEFLDLPLRCYSTGMTLRLAFAAATSCEPEILLIDEFFFTSDIGFRQRGEERLRNFMDRARIVIMVGHELTYLEAYCDRVLWMDRGTIVADGPAHEVVPAYRAHAMGGHGAKDFAAVRP